MTAGFGDTGNALGGGPGVPDPDVTGFFQYTIEGVYPPKQQNPNVRPLQVSLHRSDSARDRSAYHCKSVPIGIFA